jgi:nuclear GTP-binding protein
MIQTRRAFYKELKKVVDTADVVLQVLDARDPQGCRSREIEDMVTSQGKRLVQVLNKIDLVPPQNARAWQRHLRGEFPVVLFKASQQQQNTNFSNGVTLHKKSLTQNAQLVDKVTHLTGAVGTENLMNILKNYARTSTKREEKQVITVGVVGFPNVGKSSIINSMKRSKACNTGNQPGVTRQMQEIQLDKHVVLLDSPGIILST